MDVCNWTISMSSVGVLTALENWFFECGNLSFKHPLTLSFSLNFRVMEMLIIEEMDLMRWENICLSLTLGLVC